MKNPSYIRSLAGHWSDIWGVQREFIEAIIQIESGGVTTAANRSQRALALGGAWGLMQVTLVTARDVWRSVKPALEALVKNPRTVFIHRTAAGYVLKQWQGRPEDAQDPEVNVCLGTRYLLRLQQRFGPNFSLISAAYHQGPARVARFVRQKIAIPEGLPPRGKEYVTRAAVALDAAIKQKDRTV